MGPSVWEFGGGRAECVRLGGKGGGLFCAAVRENAKSSLETSLKGPKQLPMLPIAIRLSLQPGIAAEDTQMRQAKCCTWGVAARQAVGASVLGELEDGALAVRAGALDDNVSRVLDGHNDAGSELQLVPGLAEVHDVDTVSLATLPHVALHLEVAVLGAEVALSRKHHLHVGILLGESHGGEIFEAEEGFETGLRSRGRLCMSSASVISGASSSGHSRERRRPSFFLSGAVPVR